MKKNSQTKTSLKKTTDPKMKIIVMLISVSILFAPQICSMKQIAEIPSVQSQSA
jgi:hypothetical protein